MKPIEFIKKYNLTKGWKNKSQESFIKDMAEELKLLCEQFHAEENIKGFENAVNTVRSKWDGISNKIPYGLPDGLWNFFYASEVATLREALCPKEMARRREMAEKRKAEMEAKQAKIDARKKAEEAIFNEFAREMAMIALLNIKIVPIKSFNALGLKPDCTADDIHKAYRKLALKCHPDMGGSEKAFTDLTEHKNKCLAWVSNE